MASIHSQKNLSLTSLTFILLTVLSFNSRGDNDVQFSSIVTGTSEGAIEATMVEGGSWFNISKPVHQAIYIKHPQGNILFDTGLGKNTQPALDKLGWFDRQLFSIGDVSSVAEQLKDQNMSLDLISAIIPSHLHWDHTGGLPELAGIPVFSEQAGIDAALAGEAPAYLKEHLVDDINWQPLKLEDKPYMGFERSLDLYNDNSLVLVSLAGHTPGQVGLFLTTDTGDRYFFIGDTTWLMDGVTNNKPRPGITQWLVGVDANIEKNSKVIKQIHTLKKNDAELIIVPAHDQIAARKLPKFPVFTALNHHSEISQTKVN